MKTTRPMTKSVLAVARQALATAAAAVPPYPSRYARRDYTQHQLFALLAVRAFLGLDYRGAEQLARDWSDLRHALGLTRVPDHATLQRAAGRLLEKNAPMPCSPPPWPPAAVGSPRSPGRPWTRPGTRPGPSAGTSSSAPAGGPASGGGRS